MKKMTTVFLLATAIANSAMASEYCIESVAEEIYMPVLEAYKSSSDTHSEFTKPIPSLSVIAKLTFSELIFTHSDGRGYTVTHLNSGDDYNGWDGIYELENNWLYIAGAQYNHVIHLSQNLEGEWKADQIIRINQSLGYAERILRWVIDMDQDQIKRGGLSSILYVDSYPRYSKALKKLFYPEEGVELKNGKMVSAGLGDSFTYIDDIPRLKIAFQVPGVWLAAYCRLNNCDYSLLILMLKIFLPAGT